MRVADETDFKEDLYLTVRELLQRGETPRSIQRLVGAALRGHVPNSLQERLGDGDE